MRSKRQEMSVVNRRRFLRFNMPLDVKFKTSKEAEDYYLGVTKNFSRNGFCFETDSVTLGINGTEKIGVKPPHRDIFIPIHGEIIWTQNTKDKILAGVSIKEMDKEAKNEILEYGYNMWLEEMKTELQEAGDLNIRT